MNTLSFFNPRFTSDLFDVIDRNFSDIASAGETHLASPRVDVSETKDNYALEMELPGYTENDVEINLKNRVLTIASIQSKDAQDKKAEKADQDKTYLIKERRTCQFNRSFTLPEDIDSEGVAASFKNGLLTITIPRRAETKAMRIAISA